MTKIEIESVEEFERLCQKLVNTNMVRLKIEDEHKVVELMKLSFTLGIALTLDGKVKIEL